MAKYKTVNITEKFIAGRDEATPVIEKHCNEGDYDLVETLESDGTTVLLVFKKE